MTIERLTLVLDSNEMAALRTAAKAELRRPRDQVRAILREALGLQFPATAEGKAKDARPERAAV